MAASTASTSSLHFEQEKRLRGTVKHGILKSFMDGWFPAVSSFYGITLRKLVVYVDGFAGAGKHSTSDIGSPLVISEALAEHTNLKESASLLMILTEKKKDNYEQLIKNVSEEVAARNSDPYRKIEFINEYKAETFDGKMREAKETFFEWISFTFPECPTIFVIVEHGEFQDKMDQILEVFAENPMFIFADPFGWDGIPMECFHKILSKSHPGAPKDFLINLMDSYIRRFMDRSNLQASLKRLIGTDLQPPSPHTTWRELKLSPDERLDIIYNLYIENMHKGYKSTSERNDLLDLKFAIRDLGNRHVYHLVFFCTNIKSLKKMKYAMHRYSQSSKEFTFSGWKQRSQLKEIPVEEDKRMIEVFERINETFSGQTVTGETIETFIWKNTGIYFNFKNELKTQLEKFRCPVGLEVEIDGKIVQVEETGAFEKIVYSIPTPEQIAEEAQRKKDLIKIHYDLLSENPYDFIF